MEDNKNIKQDEVREEIKKDYKKFIGWVVAAILGTLLLMSWYGNGVDQPVLSSPVQNSGISETEYKDRMLSYMSNIGSLFEETSYYGRNGQFEEVIPRLYQVKEICGDILALEYPDNPRYINRNIYDNTRKAAELTIEACGYAINGIDNMDPALVSKGTSKLNEAMIYLNLATDELNEYSK